MSHLRENYHQLKSNLIKLKQSVSFAAALPKFFREQMSLQQAEETIKRLLENREENFLELVRRRVYERPESPYLRLLKHAGCQFSDLQACVRQRGLERTLEQLASEGVYLTAEEFKAKKDVVRGSLSFRVDPDALEKPDPTAGFVTQSSGTSNRPITAANPLDWIRLSNCFRGAALQANNLLDGRVAVYDAILPGAGGVLFLLTLAQVGIATDRWFAPRVFVSNWLESQYHRAMTHLIVVMGKTFGPGFPVPRTVDPGDVALILHWIESFADRGQFCMIRTVVSNAVRIARAASKKGVALSATRFIVSGEPLTASKAEIIRAAGAGVSLFYGYSGPFTLGVSCAKPACLDDMHVNETLHSVISHPLPIEQDNFSIHPLLITTLHASTPKLQLNVANGDFAVLERKSCGCALLRSGLTLHVSRVRSYEKFTSEGMNYFYGDLYELLERRLPAEFGGGPGDFQLVEEEDQNGQTRLTLVVHPGIREVNEPMLLGRLQQELAQGSRNNQFMSRVWQNAGTFRIRRDHPHASARGKILPLYIKH